MDIKHGGWEGHREVTLIDPQEGNCEHRNVCIQPHNPVFIGGRMVTKQTSCFSKGIRFRTSVG
jgi:hypothetical protein